MSWYNTVILSFSCDEFDDEHDEANHDCVALQSVNSWLKRQKYSKLADLNSHKSGKLGSNAVLFGGCYNYLDVEAFIKHVGLQEWKAREDVQILFWGDNDSKCSVFGFDPRRPTRGKARKKGSPQSP